MRPRQVGKTRDLMQIAAAVVGSAAAAQVVVPEYRQRGKRLACPFYRHDDPALVAAGLSVKQHVNQCPHWHQNGAEDFRTAPDGLDVHAALNTYETGAEPGVRHEPSMLHVTGANGRRLIARWQEEGIWIGGCLITDREDAEALAEFITREAEE